MFIMDSDNNTIRSAEPGDATPQSVIMVCLAENDPMVFHDNVAATCHDCGRNVVHRPDVPPFMIKVCTECIGARIRGGRA